MWRLRHRLVVTYVFIRVCPDRAVADDGWGGQLSVCRAVCHVCRALDLQSASQHLGAPNDALAAQLLTRFATAAAGRYYRGGSTAVAQLSPAMLMTTLDY